MIDLAPGWQVRCPRCGRTRPFGQIGIRFGASSIGKRVLGWCTACRWPRWGIVERVPKQAAASQASPPPGPSPPRSSPPGVRKDG